LGRNLRDSDDLSLRKIGVVKFAIYRGSLVAQITSRGIYATVFGLLGHSALAENKIVWAKAQYIRCILQRHECRC
jgi:hypothetical protein